MENGTKKLYIRIAAVLLALLAAVYLGYHILQALKKDAELFVVRPYTASDTAVFSGYFFREETAVTARTAGLCRYHYYDGEKVPRNATIASIYRFGGEAMESEIESYKKQIEILRRSESLGRLTEAELSAEIERVNFEIAEKQSAGEIAAADTLSDTLLVLMAKKELILSGKTSYATEIALLESELERLVSSLGIPSESVTAPLSGYFYSSHDGFATVFTADAVKTLDIEAFDALTTASPVYDPYAIGTLVTSSKWYYVTKTDASSAQSFIAGKTYDCRFPDIGYLETLPMKLEAKLTEGDAVLLIFFSSSLPRDLELLREGRMEVSPDSYKGLRIPAEVVRVKDGVTFVYVLKEGMATAREIDILWEQNGYFIVSESFESENDMPNLKLNDLILLETDGLYEGKFID